MSFEIPAPQGDWLPLGVTEWMIAGVFLSDVAFVLALRPGPRPFNVPPEEWHRGLRAALDQLRPHVESAVQVGLPRVLAILSDGIPGTLVADWEQDWARPLSRSNGATSTDGAAGVNDPPATPPAFVLAAVQKLGEVDNWLNPRPFRARYVPPPEKTIATLFSDLKSRWAGTPSAKRAQDIVAGFERLMRSGTPPAPRPSEPPERVLRVTGLGGGLSEFRGWRALAKPPKLDADLVLFVGPNGYGKSSALYAIASILCGHWDEGTWGKPKRSAPGASEPTRWEVEVATRTNGAERRIGSEDADGAVRFVDDKGNPIEPALSLARFVATAEVGDAEVTSAAHALLSATLLQQDRDRVPAAAESLYALLTPHRSILDELHTHAVTARDSAERALQSATEAVSRAMELRSTFPPERLAGVFALIRRAVAPEVATDHCARVGGASPPPPGQDDFGAWYTTVSAWSRSRGQRDPWSQLTAALEVVEAAVAGARAAARVPDEVSQMRRRLAEAQAKLEAFTRAHPRLDAEVAALQPAGPRAMAPGLDHLFAVLAASVEFWQSPDAQSVLPANVAQELLWVDPERARLCAREAEAWAASVAQRVGERTSLQASVDKLSDAVRAAIPRTSEDAEAAWAELQRVWRGPANTFDQLGRAWSDAVKAHDESATEQRREERDAAAAARLFSDEFVEAVEALSRPAVELRRFRHDAINDVLARFAQLIPLRLAPPDPQGSDQDGFGLDDGRTLAHLSAGQRSMMRIADFVASGEALRSLVGNEFPHRVVLVDDPIDAFDATNLQRSVMIWRQLAFHRDPDQRRQVILAVHEDIYDERLRDMLRPPDDASGRALIVRLNAYDPAQGPVFQAEALEAIGHDASYRFARTLARTLEEKLCRPY